MTAIAYDGKVIAADSMISGPTNEVNGRFPKLYRLEDGRVVGLAGDASASVKFLEYLKTNKDFNLRNTNNEFYALVIGLDGDASFWDNELVGIPVGVPYAIGSGAKYAIGAMAVGASAIQAAVIAIEYDDYSGGEVRHMKILKAG